MPGTPVPHHSVLDVGGCRLFTDVSPTSPFENTRLVECESLLQILQSDSGITLDASSDLFSPPPTLWSLDSYPFPLAQPLDVSAIGPSAHSSNDSEIVPPIPRLMLTYPTPNAPESPVFVPHSPITLTKFLSASSVLEPQVFPPLPTCDKCGLAEFEAGTQCRECEEHWVTCRVWYQANDGGRRRYLMDPYIKPAESNARNRAIMDALRVPGGNPNAMGLGLQFETRGRRARAWQRCTRLVASKTTANTLDNVANPDLPLASGLVSFLKRSWTCILRFFVTGDIRIDPYHLGRINSSPKSVHHVNQTMAPSTSLSGLSRSPRQGCIQAQHTTTSPKQSFVNPRFVEFLAGHFGYFMLRP